MNDNSHWSNLPFRRASLEEASFLLVGEGQISPNTHLTGIFCAVYDEFTAHRVAREISKQPGNKVVILPNSQALRAAIHSELSKNLCPQHEP